ncbi:MAG: peptidyl-prolyl cis-trans isomerase [Rhodobacteraceae bacterium]|nr:peptidyl-prolyl cis-trans isomerase [Paracoccaceae bacterium]
MLSIAYRLFTEPLTHFLLIGLALFAADIATRAPENDPRLIHINGALHSELSAFFEEAKGRKPSAQEMQELIDRHILNETLYREARALRLEDGDEMIRQRLMQRMRLVIYGSVAVKAPEEDDLKLWFQQRAERYLEPAEISFRVIALDGSEEEALAQAEVANKRKAEGASTKPAGLQPINLINRPREHIVGLFGEDFVRAIEQAEPEVWTPIPSPNGWQVVELNETLPAFTPSFEQARDRVLADWQQWKTQKDARGAIDAIIASYALRQDPINPELLEPSPQAPPDQNAPAEQTE